MGKTMALQEYICLSLTRCKDLGYFVPNAVAEGVMDWYIGSDQIAAAKLKTDTINGSCEIVFKTENGERLTQNIALAWRPSNLGVGGYYYFICPGTGRNCRKLYFVNGRFVSRFAFKALYKQQRESRTARKSPLRQLAKLCECEDIINDKFRRYEYRGKPTPYARKIKKMIAKVQNLDILSNI